MIRLPSCNAIGSCVPRPPETEPGRASPINMASARSIAYSEHAWPRVLLRLPPDVFGRCNSYVPRSYLMQPWSLIVCNPQRIPQHILVSSSLSGMGVVLAGLASAQTRSLRYDDLLRLAASAVSVSSFADPRMERRNPWNPANLLFTTDYDCTCTVVDSCELLVWAKENALNISDRRMMKAYEALWEEYEIILKDHIAAMPDFEKNDAATSETSTSYGGELSVELFVKLGLDPKLSSLIKSSIDSQLFHKSAKFLESDHSFDTKTLRNALKHLAGLETVLNAKVMATGFLKGLRREAIRAAGRQVVLQDHCLDVLSRITALETSIHVISANWSRDLIYGGLSFLSEDHLFVHCNDLEFEDTGESTGLFENRVINALDKENVQQTLRQIMRQDSQDNQMMVYLGDAQTDLLALLDADLGVVMGTRAALRNLLDQYGIQLRPLVEAAALLATGQVGTFRQSGFLFHTTGWEDVETCLLGASQQEQMGSDTNVDGTLSEKRLLPFGRQIKIAA